MIAAHAATLESFIHIPASDVWLDTLPQVKKEALKRSDILVSP